MRGTAREETRDRKFRVNPVRVAEGGSPLTKLKHTVRMLKKLGLFWTPVGVESVCLGSCNSRAEPY